MNIELAGMSFSVKDKVILDNISLEIPSGKTVLVKGLSGSGRTLLLKIVAGIMEATRGSIYINNVSLKGLKLNDFRSRLGIFLTEEYPFEGTLLENITFGDKNIPERDIYWAIENTGLSQFVKEQPKGLQAMIYPEGKYIPSIIGRKIVLARSIVKRPDVLILKDPLEHFEREEALKIFQFLTSAEHNWSILVASQNPIWEDKSDKIVLLKNGKIENIK